MKAMTAMQSARLFIIMSIPLGLIFAGMGILFLVDIAYPDASQLADYLFILGWGVSVLLSAGGMGLYLIFRRHTGKRLLIFFSVLSIMCMCGATVYALINATGSYTRYLLPTAGATIFYNVFPLLIVFCRLERNDEAPLLAGSANVWKDITWKQYFIIVAIIVAMCFLLQAFGIPLDRFFPGTHRRSTATRYETSTKTYKGPEVKVPEIKAPDPDLLDTPFGKSDNS